MKANKRKLELTIKACLENGDRLLDDAANLSDFERYPTAFGLAKLAQEEFSKAFILKLVCDDALIWSDEVRRSLSHHVSKQLIGIILDFINPDVDEFLEKIENKTLFKIPPKTHDAMNIYIHEILRRWQSKNWFWKEGPEYDRLAKSIFEGKEDVAKQSSFYINISKDGGCMPSLISFTQAMVGEEIEKARRYHGCIKKIVGQDDPFYKEISQIFRELNTVFD